MKRKTKAGLVWLLALSLFLSVTASAVAVAGRIRYYTAVADVDSMIPLVPEHVTEEELRNAAQPGQSGKTLSAAASGLPVKTPARTLSPINVTYCAPARLNTATRFTVSDDNTVWGTNTRVDIFKTEYANGQGSIVAASSNGDKVIAPGTENSYTFKLKNDYWLQFDYTVTVKAYVTPGNMEIPVVCRLSRYDGEWIAGGENQWLSIPEFDGATDTARIDMHAYVAYTLDWQWPFEGDDARDTALAELAAQEDLTLTIEIITTAEQVPQAGSNVTIVIPPAEDEPDAPPSGPADPNPPTPPKPSQGEPLPPKTGDENHPVLWMALAGVSFILLLILLLWRDQDDENTDPEAKKREKTKIRGRH